MDEKNKLTNILNQMKSTKSGYTFFIGCVSDQGDAYDDRQN